MSQTSRAEFAILSTLRVFPMTGERIVESCKEWFSHFWSESDEQIDAKLEALLVSGDILKLPADPGQSEDVFAITDEGQTSLRAWIEGPTKPPTLYDEFYLKFFSADAVSETVQRDLLSWKRESLETLIADAKAALAHLEALNLPNSDHWQLMVQYGLLAYEAELMWCGKAEKMLNDRHPDVLVIK